MPAPSTFDPHIADRLIDWISKGQPLRRFCAQDGMPSMIEVGRWRKRHPEFAAEYLEALEAGHDTLAEETLAIADEEPRTTPQNTIDSGHVAWAKLRIETRMRLLAKVSRRYGDKVQIGGDGGEPILLTDAQRQEKIDALMLEALNRVERSKDPLTATEASSHLHDHQRGDWDVEP